MHAPKTPSIFYPYLSWTSLTPVAFTVIATHHSPTLDPRTIDPGYQGSSISSAFATDMSRDNCWTSPAVKVWAFGHTHYNCGFRDEATGKLVVANQRGYYCADVLDVLLEPDTSGFNFVPPSQETEYEKPRKPRPLPEPTKPASVTAKLRRSLLDWAADRIPGIGRLRSYMTK